MKGMTVRKGEMNNIYRPQTKFAKVLFSQVSVRQRGACVVGLCVVGGVRRRGEQHILRDTVNERTVRILLEYILVQTCKEEYQT